MNSVNKISSSTLFFKKYIYSWLSLVLLYFFFKIIGTSNGFLYYAVWSLAILFSIICSQLQTVRFNDDVVYFNSKAIPYNKIKQIRFFEFNQTYFTLFLIESHTIVERYKITQLTLLPSMGFKTLKKIIKNSNYKETLPFYIFIQNLKEKSSVSKQNWPQ